MLFRSQVTPKGNSSYSYVSQADADAQAAQLDANGCSHCSDCSDCSRCSDCSNCSNCSHCSNCLNCSDCSDCSRCSRCSRCSHCSNCSNCSNCSRCSDCSDCLHCSRCSHCSGEIIQAGRPNGWTCYGWLKDGRLAIHCGCHTGDRAETFESAVAYWSNKPKRAEVLMACHYIAEIARQRGWALK